MSGRDERTDRMVEVRRYEGVLERSHEWDGDSGRHTVTRIGGTVISLGYFGDKYKGRKVRVVIYVEEDD